jgi:hypothetical protein
MNIKQSSGPVALTGMEPIASKVNEAWRIYEDALIPYSLRERFGGGRFAASCVCEGNLMGKGEAGGHREGILKHT